MKKIYPPTLVIISQLRQNFVLLVIEILAGGKGQCGLINLQPFFLLITPETN